MNITLKSFANIRDVLGQSPVELELPPQATLASLFARLAEQHGDQFERQIKDKTTGEIVPFLILINDQCYRTSTDMDTALNEGDTVTIMIPFDGG